MTEATKVKADLPDGAKALASFLLAKVGPTIAKRIEETGKQQELVIDIPMSVEDGIEIIGVVKVSIIGREVDNNDD